MIKANSMSQEESGSEKVRGNESGKRGMKRSTRRREWMPYPRCHGLDLVCDSCLLAVNRWFLWCMCAHTYIHSGTHTHTEKSSSKLDGPIRYGCHSVAEENKTNMAEAY